MSELQLGKLESVHPTSPVYLQRAAILAVLSFIFFLAMLIAFSVWQNFIYFLLATAFLFVQLFTLFGWFTQKKNAVEIYENGFKYKKRAWLWDELESLSIIQGQNRMRGEIRNRAGEEIVLTEAISGIDSLLKRINKEIFKRKSSPKADADKLPASPPFSDSK